MATLDDMQAGRAPGRALHKGRRGTSLGALPWSLVGMAVAAVDFVFLATLSSILGQSYFLFVLDEEMALQTHVELGTTIGLLVVAALALLGSYSRESLSQRRRRIGLIAAALLFGLMTLLAVMFLTKSSQDFSRSVIVLSFAAALPPMLLLRRAERALIDRLARSGILRRPGVMLIGADERVAEIAASGRFAEAGYAVAARAGLDLSSSDADFEREIVRLSSAARVAKPDGILLCLPWSETRKLRACISILSEHPAAIYIDGDPYLGMLSGGGNDPLGFLLVGRPLSPSQLAAKRLVDIAGSMAALLVAAPIMILAALAIRLESRGPALFVQQRYGYNREPFRIFKFRTMRAEAGGVFRQASRDDDRITRIGRFLRRTNIDELPQLINVLFGDMSLVGPRPHPIELDNQFAPLITHYTLRHRVRPGITGWAQVNGFRGETDTTDKMQGRIAHDLYYLSNWSFWFDLKIMARTVLSASAYRNAR